MQAADTTESETAALSARPSSPSWRARRRDIEHRSRQKRKVVFAALQAKINLLESVVASMPLALLDEEFIGEDELLADPPDDQEEDEDGDENKGRTDSGGRPLRDFVRRSMVLQDEASQLKASNDQLRKRVRKHEMAVAVVRDGIRNFTLDEWEVNKQRWSAMTHALFTPWTLEACEKEIDVCMREISRFSFADGNYETTGLTLLGWRDRRKLDRESGALHFSFRRTYENEDAETLATRWWNMSIDAGSYAKAILGPNVKWYYEVVQRVTPDISVVRIVEQYPNSPLKNHMLMMVCLLRTRAGFIQIHRSLPCPELQLATNDDDAVWSTNFHWMRNDVKRRNDQGECVAVKCSLSGSFKSPTVAYANRWMGELAISLVRSDTMLVGQNLLL